MPNARIAVDRLFRLALHPATLLAVSCVGLFALGNAENQWLSVPFALAGLALVAGLVFVLSARPAFSIYLGWLVIGILTVVSAIKYRMKGFSLHFFDAVFVAKDPEIYRFLFSSYLYLILPVIVLLGLGLAVAVMLYRKDRKLGWRFSVRASVPLAAAVLLPLTFPAEAVVDGQFYYMRGRHSSSFFVSLLDAQHLLTRTEFEKRLMAKKPQQPFSDMVDCKAATGRPDIFVVLSESQSDPGYFPQIAGGKDLLRKFAPGIGETRPLSVETFGGGTWISNLMLMTGLSSNDFGWRSPYLTVSLEEKVAGALPQILAQCGYRTVALMPMGYSFVNEGPFLSSIGFETVIDMNAMGAETYHLRDDFYYRAAEEFIARHRKEDGRPLFFEIQTMFPHSPYQERLVPDVAVPGEPFHEDAGVNEYLRRMAIARGDFQAFLDARKAQAGERGAVVLEFGDHQAFVTKPFIDELAGADALSRPASLAYKTYYSVTAFNHPMRSELPRFEALDIGYLGATFLDVAGLPLSPMMADLLRLRDLCKGAFYTCAARDQLDTHLRRRVDSGLLDVVPVAVVE